MRSSRWDTVSVTVSILTLNYTAFFLLYDIVNQLESERGILWLVYSSFVHFKIFLNCLCDVCYLFTFAKNHISTFSYLKWRSQQAVPCQCISSCWILNCLQNYWTTTKCIKKKKTLKTNKWDKNLLSLRVSLWGNFHFFPYTLSLIPSTQPCRESSLDCGIEFSWFSGQCY